MLVQYSKDYSVVSSQHVVMVKLYLQFKQIVKAINIKAVFKVDQDFKFENPPSDPPSDPSSGKLVGEVEETEGNGWAVAITGCPEVNPLSHNIVHM